MKRYISYLLLAAALSGMGACTKFLEEDPSILTIDTEVTSKEVARAFANSAYSEIDVLDAGSTGWGSNNMAMLEFVTGKAGGVAQTEAFKYNQLVYDANVFYLPDYWRRCYRGIQNCNVAIARLQDYPNLSEAETGNLLAEIYTMRAFYYFYLVRIFGDVPKITESISDMGEVQTVRSPVKEIYDEIIIPDLQTAEKSTLGWRDNSGRVSMGLIKALLADVYLTYAGNPVKAGTQFYAESAKRSKDLIENGGYTLFTEYADLHSPARKNGGEFIFQIQFDKVNRSNPLTQVSLPSGRDISSAYTDENGGLTPRREFVASFAANDKRAAEGQFFYTKYKPNRPGSAEVNLGAPYLYKYYDKTAVDVDAKSDVNFTVYRLADVMLLYAEASNRATNNQDALALKCVNDVRHRAGLPDVSAMPVDAFEKEVWSQRYFELCFEGKMWFDIIRTRKVRNDISKNWEDIVGHRNLYGATYQTRNLLFPIPNSEMLTNRNLVQNPGY